MSVATGLKRVLVSLLLEFARVRVYGLTLDLNRDSGDDLVKTGFRKVIVRVHPSLYDWGRDRPKCTPRGI